MLEEKFKYSRKCVTLMNTLVSRPAGAFKDTAAIE